MRIEENRVYKKNSQFLCVTGVITGAYKKTSAKTKKEYNLLSYDWGGNEVTDITTLSTEEIEELVEGVIYDITVEISRGKYTTFTVIGVAEHIGE